MTGFEVPPPGYAVIWSVGVGAPVSSVTLRCGSLVVASVVVIDAIQKCATLYRRQWLTVLMSAQVVSTAKFDLDSNENKVLGASINSLFCPIQIRCTPKWYVIFGGGACLDQ